MQTRINGFPQSGVLGYFCGKNALASVAIATEGGVRLQDTGAVASFPELQRMLASQDAPSMVEYLVSQGIKTVDGADWDESTIEAQYKASYAAQVNLGRIVDVIRQRATILSTSDVAHEVVVKDFKNEQAGVVADVDLSKAEVITFLIERASVFDLDVRTFQGVPSTEVQEGRNLLNDLIGVVMLSDDGVTEVKLVPAAGVVSPAADTTGNFGFQIHKVIPAIY